MGQTDFYLWCLWPDHNEILNEGGPLGHNVKILEFSYHGNRCHGDQNTFSEFNNGYFGIEVAYGWLLEDGKR